MPSASSLGRPKANVQPYHSRKDERLQSPFVRLAPHWADLRECKGGSEHGIDASALLDEHSDVRFVSQSCGDAIRRHQTLCSCEAADVSLNIYDQNRLQPAHEHAEPRLCFLLAGELSETIQGRTFDLLGCAAGYKPRGALHDNRWGPNGAVVLTLRIRESVPLIPSGTQAGWSPVSDWRALKRIVAIAFDDGAEARVEEAVGDLAALLPTRAADDRAAPHWLARARDEIREDPETMNVAAAAAAAGVHRTHFSRAFRQCYGLAPSEFRQRVRVARAVAELTGSDAPLSAVAANAGFFDQPHMNRAIKRVLHLAPARLREQLADATSVQSRARLTA